MMKIQPVVPVFLAVAILLANDIWKILPKKETLILEIFDDADIGNHDEQFPAFLYYLMLIWTTHCRAIGSPYKI